MHSLDQFNILTSSTKIMGKAAYSAPQSEISAAILAVKMEPKISQEHYNVSLSNPVFIGDSEIVLKMIARNNPSDFPLFYGTRIMEISKLTNDDNWFWCPGVLSPADLLTRSGSTLEKIKSRFWLQGRFLSAPTSSWPANHVRPSFSNKLQLQTSIKSPVSPATHSLPPSQSTGRELAATPQFSTPCVSSAKQPDHISTTLPPYSPSFRGTMS